MIAGSLIEIRHDLFFAVMDLGLSKQNYCMLSGLRPFMSDQLNVAKPSS